MCAKFDQNRRGSRISLVDFIWNDPALDDDADDDHSAGRRSGHGICWGKITSGRTALAG